MKGMNAIVLTGGESRRMGASKGELDYWGKAQQYRVYEMLSSYCNKVFISCRRSQAALIEPGYEVLVDNEELGEIGPMKALISAFEYERSAWLVMGCDYPLFGPRELKNLVLNRDDSRPATALWNRSIRKPEPLLAIYEPAIFEQLLQAWHQGQESLRRVLTDCGAAQVAPLEPESIESVDTLEKFLEIKKRIVKQLDESR